MLKNHCTRFKKKRNTLKNIKINHTKNESRQDAAKAT